MGQLQRKSREAIQQRKKTEAINKIKGNMKRILQETNTGEINPS